MPLTLHECEVLTILVTSHLQVEHLTQQGNAQLEYLLGEKRDVLIQILLLSTCLSSMSSTLNTKTQRGAPIWGLLDTATPATLLINVGNFGVFIYLVGSYSIQTR